MKGLEISFKDLSKGQLEILKEIYIESHINSMSQEDLRKFAKEMLDLQVRGTVGNEEEKEIWKEMEEHFGDDFEKTIKSVIKTKEVEDITINSDQEELKKRLELIENRKQEERRNNEDMWEDD